MDWSVLIGAIVPLIVAITAYIRAETARKRASDVAQSVADHVNTAHGQ